MTKKLKAKRTSLQVESHRKITNSLLRKNHKPKVHSNIHLTLAEITKMHRVYKAALYKCDRCIAPFTTLEHLRFHQRRIHRLKYCDPCGEMKDLDHSHRYEKHFQSAHTNAE